jgi:molybdopterin-binding protein
MNTITAIITEIQTCQNLHIVTFQSNDTTLEMMSLELSKELKKGTKVKLGIKPSGIAISKDANINTSHSNKIKCSISSLQNGQLLSSIKLDFFENKLEALITSSSSKKLNLKDGDSVTALIKASELFIAESIL